MSATAHVYGLLDRVGDALAEERERLELKAIEMTRRNNEQTVAGRHRMMRRADREVADPQQIDAIIATCKIVSLAYTDAEGITIVDDIEYIERGYESFEEKLSSLGAMMEKVSSEKEIQKFRLKVG